MVNNDYITKIREWITKAKEKAIVKSYSEFCEDEHGYELTADEVNYYISDNEKKNSEEQYSAYESFKESLKEVKMHREGKKKLDTWDEYIAKKHKNKH